MVVVAQESPVEPCQYHKLLYVTPVTSRLFSLHGFLLPCSHHQTSPPPSHI